MRIQDEGIAQNGGIENEREWSKQKFALDDLLGFQSTEVQKGPVLGISIFKLLATGNNLFPFIKDDCPAFNFFVAMKFRHCMVCVG